MSSVRSSGSASARSRVSWTSGRTSYSSQGTRSSSRRSGRKARGGKNRLPKVPSDGFAYDWDRVSGDTEKLIEQVCSTLKKGGSVSRLTWKKFDVLKGRARVAPRATPGPGAYLGHSRTTSLGKQVKSDRKSSSKAFMGPAHKKKHRFTMPLKAKGTVRVKCLPDDVSWGRGRPSSAEERKQELKDLGDTKRKAAEDAELTATINAKATTAGARNMYMAMAATVSDLPTTMGKNTSSKYGSAPAITFGERLENLELAKKAEIPASELSYSGLGTQLLAGAKTAPVARFGKALRQNSQIQDDYISSMPAPSTYHPKHFAGTHSEPAWSMARRTAQEYNPFMDTRAAPGRYEVEASMGKQISSVHRSNTGVPFGPPQTATGTDVSLEAARFAMAHERHQPLGTRPRPVKTFASRESKFGSHVQSG